MPPKPAPRLLTPADPPRDLTGDFASQLEGIGALSTSDFAQVLLTYIEEQK